MGTLQDEQVEFDSGAGMYLNNLIHFGLRLRHVPNVQGYFDGLLGDARQRTRYPAMPDNVPGIREWKSTIDSS